MLKVFSKATYFNPTKGLSSGWYCNETENGST
jgi:hypothetical protein